MNKIKMKRITVGRGSNWSLCIVGNPAITRGTAVSSSRIMNTSLQPVRIQTILSIQRQCHEATSPNRLFVSGESQYAYSCLPMLSVIEPFACSKPHGSAKKLSPLYSAGNLETPFHTRNRQVIVK